MVDGFHVCELHDRNTINILAALSGSSVQAQMTLYSNVCMKLCVLICKCSKSSAKSIHAFSKILKTDVADVEAS